MRSAIDQIYYWSAMLMPTRFGMVYIMRARFYFEAKDSGILVGWPWRWSIKAAHAAPD